MFPVGGEKKNLFSSHSSSWQLTFSPVLSASSLFPQWSQFCGHVTLFLSTLESSLSVLHVKFQAQEDTQSTYVTSALCFRSKCLAPVSTVVTVTRGSSMCGE